MWGLLGVFSCVGVGGEFAGSLGISSVFRRAGVIPGLMSAIVFVLLDVMSVFPS